ncbi:hypothetical protein [Methanosarcina sp.]|uniref:hypothetical protein n=1 Tax=Methanosarcina sp. TaxID=2213 RepID=UPI003C792E1E
MNKSAAKMRKKGCKYYISIYTLHMLHPIHPGDFQNYRHNSLDSLKVQLSSV